VSGATEIKPGDVVKLKSGGSPMTVAKVNGDSVDVYWHMDGGQMGLCSVPVAALEPAEPARGRKFI